MHDEHYEEMFRALDEVVEVCSTPREDDLAFGEAALVFLEEFNAFREEPVRGFLDQPLTPLATFRDQLWLAHQSDRAAGVGVVHDFVIWGRQEMARLN